MDHDVAAMLDRPAEIGRGEGRIDHQRQLGLVGDLGQARHVEHLEAGIAQHLGVDQLGLRPDRGAEALQVPGLDEARGDAEARQGMGQQVDAAAVERGRGDDMGALVHQGRDRQIHGGVARGRRDRPDAHLERRDALLEHRDGWVGDPAVDVPGALQIEQRRSVLAVVEHVGGGLVDRHRTRPGRRVGPLAGVQGKSVELEELGIGHAPPACW